MDRVLDGLCGQKVLEEIVVEEVVGVEGESFRYKRVTSVVVLVHPGMVVSVVVQVVVLCRKEKLRLET